MKQFKTGTKNAKRPNICLSLNCKTMEELKEEILKYRDYCEMIEWCVDMTEGSKDYTKEEYVAKLKEVKALAKGHKLVVDYKETLEDGNRIQRWSMGIADIIDVDFDNPDILSLVKEAHKKRTMVLTSHHEFDGMPEVEDLEMQYLKMEKTGADILKIACYANEEGDTYKILEAAGGYTQLRKHKPVVAIAMGPEGQASRICAGDFGSVISYSCGSVPTAPGQFNAKDLSGYMDTYYK